MEITIKELMQIPPFSQAIPTHSLARAKAFVRELAAGAVGDYWLYDFHVAWDEKGYEWSAWGGPDTIIGDYVKTKWGDKAPNPELLVNLGLMEGGRQTHFDGIFSLHAPSYALIEETPRIPVFISYRNSDSSAFALLLLSRMKAVGLEPFLDLAGLQGGDDWDKMLQTRLTESDTCVCLLGKTSLMSDYVQKEIRIATKRNLRIIPVFHNGFTDADLRQLAAQKDQTAEVAKLLVKSQGITVREEKARDYNSAVIDILNALGVTP
jgi:hypothetical protein